MASRFDQFREELTAPGKPLPSSIPSTTRAYSTTSTCSIASTGRRQYLTLYQQYGAASSFLTVINQKALPFPRWPSRPVGKMACPAFGADFTEVSLDVEWAHAMAPGARIILVETDIKNDPSLLEGAKSAGLSGASVVSMSFGVREGFLNHGITAGDENDNDDMFKNSPTG